MLETRNGKNYRVTWKLSVESIVECNGQEVKMLVPVLECITERDAKAKFKLLEKLLERGVFKGECVECKRVEKDTISF